MASASASASAPLPGLHRLSLHTLVDKGGVSAVLSGVNLDEVRYGNWLLAAEDAALTDGAKIDRALYWIAHDLVSFLEPRDCEGWSGNDKLFGELSIQSLRFGGGVECLLACRFMGWEEDGRNPTLELRCHPKVNMEWLSQAIFSGSVAVRTPIKNDGTGQYDNWWVLCNRDLNDKQRIPFVRAIYDALADTTVFAAIETFLKKRPSFTESTSGVLTPKRTTVPSGPSSAPRPRQKRRLLAQSPPQ
tara:strand:- start:6122 stop:6859 length:738 start_codon:yes stop_codon:yes gene_type:complete